MSLVNKETPQPILNQKAVGLKNWGIKLKNPTRSLKWDSFSKCKYIPHNVQGSYLRLMVTRTGIEPMLPP